MKNTLKWKALLIAIVIGGAVFLAYPLEKTISLGLDLQGGMHLMLEVQNEKAVETTVNRIFREIKRSIRKEDIDIQKAVRNRDYSFTIELFDKESFEVVRDIIEKIPDMVSRPAETTETKLTYFLDKREVKRIKESAVDQGLETIRNRVDEFGVAEPTIQREGEKRILIQLPGISDPERAIKLIGKTALLEFKLVDEKNSLEDARAGRIPDGDEILYEREVNAETGSVRKIPYLVKEEAILTGDYLTDARVSINQDFMQPYVSIRFNSAGASLFRQITRENVKKRLAIVLDGNIYSAPVIQEEISGGQAQITGRFTSEEARDLAIILRAGSLPAPVIILENRTVGPSLGQDSIDRGFRSFLIGGILVLVFMIVYYRSCGVIAVSALLLNMVLILGALAYFGASLTLPGIAGIVLTVGMAVDSNVLIYERIREELRVGKTVRAAVEVGFEKAFKTILDANVTTGIAAVVLFQFGTGPVKGFAVTLCIGILASMFTAVYVSRVFFDFLIGRWKLKKLSI